MEQKFKVFNYRNATKGFSILHQKTSESVKAVLDGSKESKKAQSQSELSSLRCTAPFGFLTADDWNIPHNARGMRDTRRRMTYIGCPIMTISREQKTDSRL
jgi:hypothetical protein